MFLCRGGGAQGPIRHTPAHAEFSERSGRHNCCNWLLIGQSAKAAHACTLQPTCHTEAGTPLAPHRAAKRFACRHVRASAMHAQRVQARFPSGLRHISAAAWAKQSPTSNYKLHKFLTLSHPSKQRSLKPKRSERRQA